MFRSTFDSIFSLNYICGENIDWGYLNGGANVEDYGVKCSSLLLNYFCRCPFIFVCLADAQFKPSSETVDKTITMIFYMWQTIE